jgi:hypothetical protein
MVSPMGFEPMLFRRYNYVCNLSNRHVPNLESK